MDAWRGAGRLAGPCRLLLLTVILASCETPNASSGASRLEPSTPTPSPSPTSSGGTSLDLVWRVDHGLGRPTGIAIRPDGSLLVVDFDSGAIHSISADGSAVAEWGETTSGPGALAHPAGIAVDADGRVFVADHDHFRIARFTAAGGLDMAWGARGTATGKFDAPDVVSLDPTGELYVSEDRNARVQVFERDGAFVREIRAPGSEAFQDPTGVAFANGSVFVADYQASVVWALDQAGALLRTIGEPGAKDGQLKGLSMIATTADGRLVVTDYDNGRLQAFMPDGTWLATYLLEDGRRMARPWGLVVGPDGDLYVAEFTAGRVSRFRIPPP